MLPCYPMMNHATTHGPKQNSYNTTSFIVIQHPIFDTRASAIPIPNTSSWIKLGVWLFKSSAPFFGACELDKLPICGNSPHHNLFVGMFDEGSQTFRPFCDVLKHICGVPFQAPVSELVTGQVKKSARSASHRHGQVPLL